MRSTDPPALSCGWLDRLLEEPAALDEELPIAGADACRWFHFNRLESDQSNYETSRWLFAFVAPSLLIHLLLLVPHAHSKITLGFFSKDNKFRKYYKMAYLTPHKCRRNLYGERDSACTRFWYIYPLLIPAKGEPKAHRLRKMLTSILAFLRIDRNHPRKSKIFRAQQY